MPTISLLFVNANNDATFGNLHRLIMLNALPLLRPQLLAKRLVKFIHLLLLLFCLLLLTLVEKLNKPPFKLVKKYFQAKKYGKWKVTRVLLQVDWRTKKKHFKEKS